MEKSELHWASVRQIGPYWGMRFVLLLQSLLGTRLCLFLITPVVGFYFLFNRHGRLASQDYLQQISSYQPELQLKANWRTSFKHFLAFTEAMLDKLATWNGKIGVEDVDIHGREAFLSSLKGQQGAVILCSHLGNIEVSHALANLNAHAKLNILAHTKHAQTFNRLIKHVSRSEQVELIEVTEISPAVAIMLQEKIAKGEFVCIVGDRIPVNNQTRIVACDFLGKPAYFAQGPFILASLLKCPVYTLFCLKIKGRYRLYFEHFADQITLARKDKDIALQQYAMQFAQRLQQHCIKAPLQWFNFYFYWQDYLEDTKTGTDNQ